MSRRTSMKQLQRYIRTLLSVILTATTFAITLFLLPSGLVAQSADVFKPEEPSNTTEVASDTSGDSSAPGLVDPEPSRFAGDEIEAYVAARAALLSMRDRAVGPFGLFQDPTIQPIVKQADSELPSRRQAALPAVPLLDIVKLIRVTTVMPREKMFLVGVRKFREGDEFPLEYQNKTLQIRVIDVTANKIRFRDMKTGEDAALETGILPPGMIIGGDREMRPPGMVSPTENTPLRLESGNLENR